MAEPLEVEIKTYERLLPDLGEHQGKFALIKGEELVGVFEAYADALKIGYERFQLDPFLVKQISIVGDARYFTRDIQACPT